MNALTRLGRHRPRRYPYFPTPAGFKVVLRVNGERWGMDPVEPARAVEALLGMQARRPYGPLLSVRKRNTFTWRAL